MWNSIISFLPDPLHAAFGTMLVLLLITLAQLVYGLQQALVEAGYPFFRHRVRGIVIVLLFGVAALLGVGEIGRQAAMIAKSSNAQFCAQ